MDQWRDEAMAPYALREAQERISERIVGLLGLTAAGCA
jgi:hypothetical protein